MNEMTDVESAQINGMNFYTGRIGGSSVTVSQCGIGKVNAAIGALTLIDSFRPDAIINTGIAGGTGVANILDVVIGTEIGYYDVWCGPRTEVGEVQGLPGVFPGAPEVFGVNRLEDDPRVLKGLIASGDRFISTKADLDYVLSVRPKALAVDMESGAIAQVCYLRGVPFLAIRVVSDTPGVTNHLEQYADFWTLAPKSTFSILRTLIG